MIWMIANEYIEILTPVVNVNLRIYSINDGC